MIALYLDNDFEFVWNGQRRNTGTGELEPATALSSLTARFSATDGGPAIHAALDKNMAERAGTPGEYFAVVDGDALRAHLAGSIGSVVYEVFGDGTNLLFSVPRRVVERRRA